MYKEIEIGNKKVKMKADGFSPILFNAVFKDDFFGRRDAMAKGDDNVTIDTFTKMAFIMSEQAKNDDPDKLMKINLKSYYKWLQEFAPLDLPDAVPDIIDVYMEQEKTTATSKK